MSAAILEGIRIFIITSGLLVIVLLLAILLNDWLAARKVRKAAAAQAAKEAQERAWWGFWAAMHGAQGGEPVPYPGDGDEGRQP